MARLALPLLMITVALVAWSTLDMFRSRPAEMGVPAALTVRAEQPGSLTDQELDRALTAPPDVAAVHPGVEVAALVPGQTGTITLRGLGTARAPTRSPSSRGAPPTASTRRSPVKGCSICWMYGSATGCG